MLLEAIDTRQGSHVLFIAHPTIVKRLSMRTAANGSRQFPALGLAGGDICPNVTLLPSDRIEVSTIAAIDAAQAITNPGTVVPSSSNQALIDLAAGESGSPQLLALWQANCVSVRLERQLGLAIPNASSVAAINSVSYANLASS